MWRERANDVWAQALEKGAFFFFLFFLLVVKHVEESPNSISMCPVGFFLFRPLVFTFSWFLGFLK